MRVLAFSRRTCLSIFTCKIKPNCVQLCSISWSSTATGSPPWNVLYFGTDLYSTFALDPLLKRIAEPSGNSLISRLSVCSRFKGPSCELAKYARKLAPESDCLDYSPDMAPYGYDLGLVASFGSLIPTEIVNAFPYGILCIHPSLLPRWRGAAPLMRTILDGDAITGVSLMRIMPKKFDVGPVASQISLLTPDRVFSRDLGRHLMELGVDMFLETLGHLPESLAKAKPQPADGVTYAKKVKLKETFIDWTWTVSQIDRCYRALSEDFGTRTSWEGSVVKIGSFLPPQEAKEARVDELAINAGLRLGGLFFHKKRNVLFVKCADGWVGLRELVVPDRKPMSAKDFYNGFLSPNKNRQTVFGSGAEIPSLGKRDQQ